MVSSPTREDGAIGSHGGTFLPLAGPGYTPHRQGEDHRHQGDANIQKIAGNTLVKIETDSGLVGYGEAGVSGPMGRARLDAPIPLPGGIQGIGHMRDLLIGKDPLAIEVHFQNMTSLMHYYMANIPTVSGIDIALWDLAGKITGLPVYSLLGGRFVIPFACIRTATA